MTAQEAIRQFEDDIDTCNRLGNFEDEIEANGLAIEALELQIPQKPNQDKDTKYRCPICNNWIRHWQKFCDECGQMIDWTGDGKVVAKSDEVK